MKPIYSSTLLLSFFTCLLLASSCTPDDNDNTNNELRDVTFTANVTGDYTQSINFTLEAGVATQEVGISSVHLSSSDRLSINAVSGTWGLIVAADVATLATGSFPMGTGFSTYYNTGSGPAQFIDNSGSVQITSVESTSPNGTANDRYISGTFSVTMSSTDNPPLQVQINGTFTNVFVSGS